MADGTEIAWLHCQACCRSFEHHAAVRTTPAGDLEVSGADTAFAFTSCGHFFCAACVSAATVAEALTCPVCGTRAPATMALGPGPVPASLALFLRSPQTLLEDALSAMSFQLGSGTRLIRSLRAKVAQQKDILAKARRELAAQRQLREKLAEVGRDNAALRRRLESVSAAAGGSFGADACGRDRSEYHFSALNPCGERSELSVSSAFDRASRHAAHSRSYAQPQGSTREPGRYAGALQSPRIAAGGRLSLRSPMLALPVVPDPPPSSPLGHAMAAPRSHIPQSYSRPHDRGRGGTYSAASSRSSWRTPPRRTR